MKKTHKEQVPIPFEEGKTYITKFATGESFTITKLLKNKYDEVIGVKGIYTNCPHLGECGLDIGRLVQPMRYSGIEYEVTQCPQCKHEFK